MTGDTAAAEQARERTALLYRCEVLPHRGEGFPTRLANAHADVADRHPGGRTVQIRMDIPQVTPRTLADALDRLDAVLGHVVDGGCWGLGLRDPRTAYVPRTVPTSRPDPRARNHDVPRSRGYAVRSLPTVSDVDCRVTGSR